MSNVISISARAVARAQEEADSIPRRVEVDPRSERTAGKMIKRGFLSDLAKMSLNDAMNSVFDDDGPEAA